MTIPVNYTPSPFLIVIVPEGATKIHVPKSPTIKPMLGYSINGNWKFIPLPPGHYGTPFLVSEATEGTVEKLVYPRPSLIGRIPMTETEYNDEPDAIEELHSILEKENIYFKNKYGEKEPVLRDYGFIEPPHNEGLAIGEWEDWTRMRDQWHSFQQRVFRPEQVVIIPKNK